MQEHDPPSTRAPRWCTGRSHSVCGADPMQYTGRAPLHRGTGSEHRIERVFYFTLPCGDSPSHEGGNRTGELASPARGRKLSIKVGEKWAAWVARPAQSVI